MHRDDDTRGLEQKLAAGQSEATPFFALGTVVGVIAALVVVALTLAAIAYFVA